MSKILKPALACTVALGSLALSASAFAFAPLAQGYALGATAVAGDDKAAEGSCGGDKAAHEGNCGADKAKAEGKCGEGKCGGMRMDADKDGMVSAAEHAAAASRRFAAADSNKDGMVDAAEMKASHEGKCGEGKCGAK